MHRPFRTLTLTLTVSALVATAACAGPDQPDLALAAATQELGASFITRTHVAGDVYHYQFTVPVGASANARLAIHRVVRERGPWQPRPTRGPIFLTHGDFASFASNFAPVLGTGGATELGLATWLAERGVDVWGLDRRWTQAPVTGGDLTDFADMGITQELDDMAAALAFARGVRLVTTGSSARMTLVGFSRGGQLAYLYASREAALPAARRHVKGLVPLDVYASVDPADDDLRQFWCDTSTAEQATLDAGEVDVSNVDLITTGQLAESDPDGQVPFFPFPATNREWMLSLLGETYYYFGAAPLYHLLAPILDEDTYVIGLRTTSELTAARWLAGAAPHQALRESVETDALLCGDQPPAVDLPLARIQVPLLLVAAAGGYGAHAIYSTTQVASTDVTVELIRQLPVEREAEDFGHADLLFAPEAPVLAWTPLLAWLDQH